MTPHDPERQNTGGRDPQDHTWPPLEQPSELVQRLRNLQWPEASAEARQRCWAELTRQMETLAGAEPAEEEECASTPQRRGSDGQHERRFGRHDFANWGMGLHKGALAERVAATHGLARAAGRI